MTDKLKKIAAVPDKDILFNQPWGKFSPDQKKTYKAADRMLQDGACRRSTEGMISDIETLGVAFISSAMCPSVKATISFHLAADMVNLYKVKEDELNAKVKDAFGKISEAEISAIQQKVDQQVGALPQESLNKKALAVLAQNGKITKAQEVELQNNPEALEQYKADNAKFWEAANNIGKDLLAKDIIYKEVGQYIDGKKTEIYAGLELKPVMAHGQNSDITILGAQGSGKSTAISNLGIDQTNFSRAVSVDDFRPVSIPGVTTPKDVGTNNLLETQNYAFFAKSLAMDKVVALSNARSPRPNIMVDAVTPDPNVAKILTNPKSYLVAYSPANTADIVDRVHDRATSSDDKEMGKRFLPMGAHVLVTHKGSYDRSYNVPIGRTEMLDTDIKPGEQPRSIGAINKLPNGEMSLEVVDIKSVAEFFNKKNINEKADTKLELSEFLSRPDTSKTKADSLIGLLSHKVKEGAEDVMPFKEIKLMKEGKSTPYVIIKKGVNGELSVTYDITQLKKQLSDPNNGEIKKNILREVFKAGKIEEVFDLIANPEKLDLKTMTPEASTRLLETCPPEEIQTLSKAISELDEPTVAMRKFLLENPVVAPRKEPEKPRPAQNIADTVAAIEKPPAVILPPHENIRPLGYPSEEITRAAKPFGLTVRQEKENGQLLSSGHGDTRLHADKTDKIKGLMDDLAKDFKKKNPSLVKRISKKISSWGAAIKNAATRNKKAPGASR